MGWKIDYKNQLRSSKHKTILSFVDVSGSIIEAKDIAGKLRIQFLVTKNLKKIAYLLATHAVAYWTSTDSSTKPPCQAKLVQDWPFTFYSTYNNYFQPKTDSILDV